MSRVYTVRVGKRRAESYTVRVGKRRAESTASIHSNNNPVMVIDYTNPNPNPFWSELRTQMVSHRRGGYLFTAGRIRRLRGVTNRRYITSWDENGFFLLT